MASCQTCAVYFHYENDFSGNPLPSQGPGFDSGAWILAFFGPCSGCSYGSCPPSCWPGINQFRQARPSLNEPLLDKLLIEMTGGAWTYDCNQFGGCGGTFHADVPCEQVSINYVAQQMYINAVTRLSAAQGPADDYAVGCLNPDGSDCPDGYTWDPNTEQCVPLQGQIRGIIWFRASSLTGSQRVGYVDPPLPFAPDGIGFSPTPTRNWTPLPVHPVLSAAVVRKFCGVCGDSQSTTADEEEEEI